MLKEGRWRYKIDEKGRVPLPPELREIFGKEAIVALEPPEGPVVIYLVSAWERKLKDVLEKVGSRQQFTLSWMPFTVKLDAQGRISLPDDHRKLLEKRVIVVSMGDDGYLKVINDEDLDEESLVGNPTMKPFQSAEEAEEYFSKGKDVVYIGNNGRKVIGKLKSRCGGFFNFIGKDEHGVIVSLDQAPYWQFYTLAKGDETQ